MRIILFLLLLFVACDNTVYKKSSLQLGTVINLTMIGDAATATKAAQAAFAEIERLENLLSPYRKKSDIFAINASAHNRKIAIAPETMMLIKKSIELSQETAGAFDITFASIAHLWNYKKAHFVPPTRRQVNSIRHLVNYKHIILANEHITLAYKGVKIGLGAIAKGYAVRRCVEIMKAKGIKAGIVEEGGDLQVFGDKFGKPWKTGIMHPRKKDLLLIIELDDMEAIATSGDYERVAYYQNKRYHHIIDPQSGFPAETFASVSVVTRDPMLSDAYATALFVMGIKKASLFLKKHKEIGAILVDLNGKVYLSEKLKKKITIESNIPVFWL